LKLGSRWSDRHGGDQSQQRHEGHHDEGTHCDIVRRRSCTSCR
jgi:hypothetical protein